MSDTRGSGANGGKKVPRTLFSLGRSKGSSPEPDLPPPPVVDHDEAGATDVETTNCPSCGVAMPPGARFCGECGTALPDDQVAAAPVGDDEVEYEVVDEADGEVGDEEYVEVMLCPTCDAELPLDARFCGECGTAIEVEDEAEEDAASVLPPPPPVAEGEPVAAEEPVVDGEPVVAEESDEATAGETVVLPPPPPPPPPPGAEETGGTEVPAASTEDQSGDEQPRDEDEDEDRGVGAGAIAAAGAGVVGGVAAAEVLGADAAAADGALAASGAVDPNQTLDLTSVDGYPQTDGGGVEGAAYGTETVTPAEPAQFVDSLSGPGTAGGAQPEFDGQAPKSSNKGIWIGAAAVAVVICLIAGIALLAGGGDDGDDEVVTDRAADSRRAADEDEDDDDDEEATTTAPPETVAPTTAPPETAAPTTAPPATPPPSQSTPQTSIVVTPPPVDNGGGQVGGTPALSVSGLGNPLQIPCNGSASFSIQNTGTGIGSFLVQGGQLSIAPGSGAVSPGSSQTVTVTARGCEFDTNLSVSGSGLSTSVAVQVR